MPYSAGSCPHHTTHGKRGYHALPRAARPLAASPSGNPARSRPGHAPSPGAAANASVPRTGRGKRPVGGSRERPPVAGFSAGGWRGSGTSPAASLTDVGNRVVAAGALVAQVGTTPQGAGRHVLHGPPRRRPLFRLRPTRRGARPAPPVRRLLSRLQLLLGTIELGLVGQGRQELGTYGGGARGEG